MSVTSGFTEEIYTMWLTSVEGIRGVKSAALLKSAGSARAVWENPEIIVRTGEGSQQILNRIKAARNDKYMEDLLNRVDKSGFRFVTIKSPDYPPLLKHIYNPPAGLYMAGQTPCYHSPLLAVIGSRECSGYGRDAARKLSRELCQRGVTIVSGMARGIDGEAHRGALEAGGPTIAVLGSGPDICYPPEHFELERKIMERGLVITEYPPGERPNKQNFPQRNRIISGISHGLLVVEAGEASGTHTTVDAALEAGREVFALPGNIFSKTSKGANTLIQEGACLVTCFEDILFGLGDQQGLRAEMDDLSEKTNGKKNDRANYFENSHKTVINTLVGNENLVYSCIGEEGSFFEEIQAKAGLAVPELSFILVNLELNGFIRSLPGGRYSLIHR